MFTGIIEKVASLKNLHFEQGNLHLWIKNPFSEPLKINQSIAHSGICLSVNDIAEDAYKVVAIEETLQKTNLKNLKKGDLLNLERALKLNDRLEGHLLQGHVDLCAKLIRIEKKEGSWIFSFKYDASYAFHTIIEKGSIGLNGVSLTLIGASQNEFSVAIIPYTYGHTNFSSLREGDLVNVEFDLIGKYIYSLSKNKLRLK